MKIYNQSIRKLFFKSSCAICKKESEQEICIYCLTKLQDRSDLKKWSNVYYLWEYDNFIRSLISSYKHKNRIRVGKEIEKIITPKIKEVIRREKINRVMIIPISYSRKNKRGFNQVEELLKSGKIPYKNGKRVRDTVPMFKLLNREKRELNIKGAFKITENLKGKKVLVIDDIVTTGSTMKEYIKEIKKQAPEKIVIFSLSLARTFLEKEVSL